MNRIKAFLLLLLVVDLGCPPAKAITNVAMLAYDGSVESILPALPPVRIQVFACDLVAIAVPPNIWSSYQWRKNGMAIPGATAGVYAISGASGADNGVYTVSGVPISSATATFIATPVYLSVV